ncbi:MAG: hypothetical protein ACLP4W_19485 [Mycobacterium sp.]|uniref:hypothetical protein n=1 Tax=Mycobacterium sp. TaxID=1785 RepID=UPI003F9DBB3B
MILSNTLTSATVQGTAVQAAADDNPVLGFGVVGNGRNWISTPGFANSAVLAAGTLGVGATLNIDWTQVGYATLTLAASGTNVITFATTATASLAAASQVASFQLGQTLHLRITGGGAAVTWPTGTFSYVTASVALSTTNLTMTGTTTWDMFITCTGVGSSPTFDVTYQVT